MSKSTIQTQLGRRRPFSGSQRLLAGVAIVAMLLSACSEDTSTDLETGPNHSLEPTDEMRDLAVQQCLDDPSLDEGVVRAVDPAPGGEEVFAEVIIECDTVR